MKEAQVAINDVILTEAQSNPLRYNSYKKYLEEAGALDKYLNTTPNRVKEKWVNAILEACKLLNINEPVRNMLNHAKLSHLVTQLQISELHSDEIVNVLNHMLEIDEQYLKHALITPFLHEPVIVTRQGNLTLISPND